MPLFLTLRDGEGNALTTAMLPPGGKDRGGFRIIIVAASNADPYPQQDAAIATYCVAARSRSLTPAQSCADPFRKQAAASKSKLCNRIITCLLPTSATP